MRITQLIAIALVAVCLIGSGQDGRGQETRRAWAPIERVEITIAESFPPQYFAQVTYGLPSGCARHDGYDQERQETSIKIDVWNRFPADPNVACTMIYGMGTVNVPLGSDFTPAQEYLVRVNDVEQRFTAQ